MCITAADGQTGRLAAELLLTNNKFSKKFKSISLLALNPAKCHDLKLIGGARVNVIAYTSDKTRLLNGMKAENCDTIFLIPPAIENKFAIMNGITECARKLKSIQNMILLSSAGCDVAEREKQSLIRQFINMEALVMNAKSEPESGSTCIIR